jgi:hypothetical protein
MTDREPRVSGATARAGAPRRRTWLLWLLVALLLVAALLFALSRCGTSTDPTAGPGPADTPVTSSPAAGGASTPAASPTAPATGPAGPASAGAAPPPGTGASEPGGAGGGSAGTLTAGGAALLPVSGAAGPDGSLSGLVGQQVSAAGVAVQSVPANEGFWVGTSDADRVWVQLLGEGESDYVVRPGDRVEFTGRLVGHDEGFAGAVGVDQAEGARQLTGQAAHVEVPQAELRGSQP